ncbi:hypothetical protein BFP97_18255 [Roseivirga sp. 4D4]|uniref:hypothetical protein n=1 Tax=Roseivirga sp. 4D4 TaxID=1889784 RepID=UPI0008536090|nr:hypothetical protein [Roseivirga sp. 4D4]OEK03346.1 hypothetical protein BFP97_18255 [Roseivirga sp. 4D4]
MFVPAFGQIEHLNRYELENTWDNLDYLVISNEDNGVMLVRPMNPGSSRNGRVDFSFLNTELESEWDGFFEVKKGEFMRGYHYHGGVNYLLFQMRSDNRFVKIVALDAKGKGIKVFEPKQIVDLEISEFEAIKGSAVVGGYIEGRPAVFVYDMEADEVRTLPNVYQNNSDLLEVRINSDSVTFNVLASQLDDKKDRTVLVNTYDYEGNVVRGYELQTDTEHQLVSAISSSIIDKEQVVVGLYSVKAGTYPSGFFINHVDRTGRQTMNYMNFGEFETFLDHTGKRRAPKMKERALAAKKNRRDWRYKTDALFREMIETDDALIVAGEFYKPWTVTTSNNWRSLNRFGNPAFFNDPTFNPYSNNAPFDRNFGVRSDFTFTHAFALVIDQKGNVKWDASFDIDEHPEATLEDFGAFQWSGDEAFYAFYHDEELVVKHLNDKENKEGSAEPLALMEEGEEIRLERDDFRGITRWFDNRYLVFGVQTIKSSGRGSSSRKVFFINSVAVSPAEKAGKL